MSSNTTTIKAYIGSNNITKELEVDKIIEVTNRRHAGFTLDSPLTGYWDGELEQTAVLTISDSKDKVLATLIELKEVLKQEAIAYQIENKLHII